jgi:hypothetical protein
MRSCPTPTNRVPPARSRSAYRPAVLLAGLAAAVLLTPGPARATGTLTSAFPLLFGVSCSATSLCVAVDDKSNAIISSNPTAATPIWRASAMRGLVDPEAVSCVATAMCVVVDSNGLAAISTNPTTAAPTWNVAPVFNHRITDGISCPSTSMCVAVNSAGEVATSTNPTATVPTWSTRTVDSEAALNGVSCTSSVLCVAVDSRGRAVVSTNPTSASPTWTPPAPIDSGGLSSISCPSISLCVAVDYRGETTTSRNPASATHQWSVPVPILNVGTQGASVSCQGEALCIAVGSWPFVTGISSTDPASPAASWTPATSFGFGAGESPAKVSCFSMALCVIVARTSASISTDPSSARPTWSLPAVIDEIPAGRLELRSPLSTRGRALSFGVHCAGEPIQACPGTATVSATERLSARGHRVIELVGAANGRRTRRVPIGRASFTCSAIGSESNRRIGIKLNGLGRRLLARFRRVPATLAVTAPASEARTPARLIVVGSEKVVFAAKR